MNGFFLAAGFGTRMKDLVQDIPKPLLPIQGVRLLDYSLYLGKKWGVRKAIVNTHYLGDLISKHLESFREYPVFVSHEENILGTAGGIAEGLRRYPDLCDEDLLVLNPDTIFLPDLDSFLPAFEYPSYCHLYLLPKKGKASYTSIFLNSGGQVKFESPYTTGGFYYIGVSLFRREFLREMVQTCFGYAELLPLWKELSAKNRITGSIFPGKALDVGEKNFYESLNRSSDPIWSPSDRWNIRCMFQE